MFCKPSKEIRPEMSLYLIRAPHWQHIPKCISESTHTHFHRQPPTFFRKLLSFSLSQDTAVFPEKAALSSGFFFSYAQVMHLNTQSQAGSDAALRRAARVCLLLEHDAWVGVCGGARSCVLPRVGGKKAEKLIMI